MQPNLIAAFVVLFAVFVPVERLFALRRRKVFRKGWLTDRARTGSASPSLPVTCARWDTLPPFGRGDECRERRGD